MATIDLGRIKFKWQGAYNGATAYVVDDVVSYNGSSYVCILASTGNVPTNTTYWNIMAQAGTDITSLAGLAQGDILYYDGSNWVRLGAGTNGQFLQTQGTGANPQWATNTAAIKSVYVEEFTTRVVTGTGTDIFSGNTYNQQNANGNILITASITGDNPQYDGKYVGKIIYDGVTYQTPPSTYVAGSAYVACWTFRIKIAGSSTAGNKTWLFGHYGSTRSLGVINPNSSDHSNYPASTKSTFIFEEIA